jgi:Na+/H+ antiporter NhaC
VENSNQSARLGPLSLLPFLLFLSLYIGAGLWFYSQGIELAFYQFPAPSCALFAFALALLLGFRNVRFHIKTFTSGIGDETVVLMCLIFLLAGGFSALSKASGAVESSVNLGIYLLPDQLLLPGLFLISCLIALAMGTSMGTISTMLPIGLGLAESTGLNVALLAATVVGGAMFGDNLSVISDTTLAATGTQGAAMKDKMRANLKLALPAALLVFIVLIFLAEPTAQNLGGDFSLVLVLPYALVLLLALLGVHVIVVLLIGILASSLAGILTNAFSFFALGKIIYEGFISMADVFFVSILIAGLAAIAAKEGGLDWLLAKINPWAKTKRSAEFVIATSVSLADICVANNTVAILFAGPLAKKIADKFAIDKGRSASIIDVFSCIFQGIIPHGAQLLLAGGLCKLSGFAILPYSFYPFALAFFTLASMVMTSSNREKL